MNILSINGICASEGKMFSIVTLKAPGILRFFHLCIDFLNGRIDFIEYRRTTNKTII